MRGIQDHEAFSHRGIGHSEGPGESAAPIVADNNGFIIAQIVDQAGDIA
jgi:hypothetical protein